MIKSDLYSQLNISRIDTRSTNTYSLNGFFFDIVTIIDDKKVRFESYLYHPEYSVKHFMFGVSAEQSSYDEYLVLVVGNIDEYIDYYRYEYMIDDDLG